MSTLDIGGSVRLWLTQQSEAIGGVLRLLRVVDSTECTTVNLELCVSGQWHPVSLRCTAPLLCTRISFPLVLYALLGGFNDLLQKTSGMPLWNVLFNLSVCARIETTTASNAEATIDTAPTSDKVASAATFDSAGSTTGSYAAVAASGAGASVPVPPSQLRLPSLKECARISAPTSDNAATEESLSQLRWYRLYSLFSGPWRTLLEQVAQLAFNDNNDLRRRVRAQYNDCDDWTRVGDFVTAAILRNKSNCALVGDAFAELNKPIEQTLAQTYESKRQAGDASRALEFNVLVTLLKSSNLLRNVPVRCKNVLQKIKEKRNDYAHGLECAVDEDTLAQVVADLEQLAKKLCDVPACKHHKSDLMQCFRSSVRLVLSKQPDANEIHMLRRALERRDATAGRLALQRWLHMHSAPKNLTIPNSNDNDDDPATLQRHAFLEAQLADLVDPRHAVASSAFMGFVPGVDVSLMLHGCLLTPKFLGSHEYIVAVRGSVATPQQPFTVHFAKHDRSDSRDQSTPFVDRQYRVALETAADGRYVLRVLTSSTVSKCPIANSLCDVVTWALGFKCSGDRAQNTPYSRQLFLSAYNVNR